jgi:hypothetical protein
MVKLALMLSHKPEFLTHEDFHKLSDLAKMADDRKSSA